MKLLRNVFSVLRQPSLGLEYVSFLTGRLLHGGEAVRTFPADNIEIGQLSGFSEFHSCVQFINAHERLFLNSFPFGDEALMDVGANLGLFSLLLSRHFPGRSLYAFEPNPTTFLALQSNLARNRCWNAQAHHLAVADRVGEIPFEIDPVNRATTRIGGSDSRHDNGRLTLAVPCVTLDTFIEQHHIAEIALLKVDVEGYETLVLRGARAALARRLIQVIYFEVCPELTRTAGFTTDELADLLTEHGYTLHRIGRTGELIDADRAQMTHVGLENWVALAPKV